MRDHVNDLTNPEIAAALGIKLHSVNNRMHRLGIYRSPEARARMERDSQFKKGHVPANKGIKGIHNSPDTEFKKGHKPVNTKYDGCISVRKDKRTGRPYRWIRLAENKWDLLHRVLWKRHIGPLNRTDVISFKNGDSLDCRLENLQKISMRQNMDNNRNYESEGQIAHYLAPRDSVLKEEVKKHPQLIELKKMQLRLRRAINGVI